MGMFDGIVGQLEGQAAAAIAAKMGIDPSMAQMAITALTAAHPQPGDTVTAAAASSGLSTDMLGQIMGHIGGEGGLGSLVSAIGGGAQPQAQSAEPEAAGGLGGLGGILGSLMGGTNR